MANILQLKIILRHVKPPVWRRILVKDDINFLKLHHIIQISMGWYDCHLHQFVKGRERYIGNMKDLTFDEAEDESAIKISEILTVPKNTIRYDYDFGDNWEHDIILEKILDEDEKISYPRCIKGKHCCPPEDVGGVGGYMDMLKLITSGKGKEKKEMLEWLGGGFDPAYFNMKDVNEELYEEIV